MTGAKDEIICARTAAYITSVLRDVLLVSYVSASMFDALWDSASVTIGSDQFDKRTITAMKKAPYRKQL